MPRPLSIGNGNLLINFDADLVMRDFFFPYVGMMNQIEGRRNMMGFWVDGHFSWLDEPGWSKTWGYLDDTLVTACTARSERLGLALTISDAVHYREDLYLKRVVIRNLRSEAREVRVFFANDFNIDESDIGDTALFDPDLQAIYHYKRKRCLIIDGRIGPSAGKPARRARGARGIAQFSTGRKRFAGAEGTWRDAEDGKLEGHLISQGSVDSAIGFQGELGPGKEQQLYYWIAAGSGFDSARAIHGLALTAGPERLMSETATFWRNWVSRHSEHLAGLPPELASFFKRSILVARTQIDNRGGIVAANDTDILRHNRDHYSYVWARDGAMVAHALDLAGYHGLTRRFFRFCERAISRQGFLWHKYHPNGSVGSSWHPWVRKGDFLLPVQEDETASVLWALGRHYAADRDLDFVDTLYPTLVEPAANFLANYRDPETKLPRPSYDLWEERQGIFTYTAASTYAGLMAASLLGELFGDRTAAEWRAAAEEVKEATLTHLYDKKLGRFLRGLYVRPDGEASPDYTLDSSLFGVALFGLLPAGDERVLRTMKLVQDGLWVSTDVGGVARYTGDYYFRKSDDVERVPGNPWIICTLWLARWYIAKASSVGELKVALAILEWVRTHAIPGGHLPEQLHPYSGQALSVAPLTWSHAEAVSTVLEYLAKVRELGVTVEFSEEDRLALPSSYR
ncbi:MAG: glycoside hydrolase family 15 protein [Bacillota bacterium]|nr:MAG: glycoside hydrolase family 15 protein [Bacillota bacterium]